VSARAFSYLPFNPLRGTAPFATAQLGEVIAGIILSTPYGKQRLLLQQHARSDAETTNFQPPTGNNTFCYDRIMRLPPLLAFSTPYGEQCSSLRVTGWFLLRKPHFQLPTGNNVRRRHGPADSGHVLRPLSTPYGEQCSLPLLQVHDTPQSNRDFQPPTGNNAHCRTGHVSLPYCAG